MIRGLAALTAGAAAAIAAAGAAVGLRRRRRAARRAERQSRRRPGAAVRAPQASAKQASAKQASAKQASAKQAAATAAPAVAPDPGSTPALTLRSIKGIGDVAERRLAEAGITSVEQVAAWTDADVERVASQVRISAERIRREDWVGQAQGLTTSS